MAAADICAPVAVALLVAGAPTRLPGRRAAAGAEPGTGDRDRGAGPHRAAAQLRVVDQRLLRRHRLVRTRRAAGRTAGPPIHPVGAGGDHPRLQAGWTPAGGGGIWWRRGDNFKNAPANGPAAILAARVGNVEFAAAITDWMTATLLDPESGLVRDGVRLNPDGSIRTVETTTYTYCQGVYLGACIELAERDGHPRWAERAAAVLDAIATRMAEPNGVLPGFDDGGDGGLFNGILARYLADAAARRPELAPVAARLVLASADAAWRGRAEVAGGPVFAQDWRQPAREPRMGVAEADLSVQLSAWMLLEAAATVARSA